MHPSKNAGYLIEWRKLTPQSFPVFFSQKGFLDKNWCLIAIVITTLIWFIGAGIKGVDTMLYIGFILPSILFFLPCLRTWFRGLIHPRRLRSSLVAGGVAVSSRSSGIYANPAPWWVRLSRSPGYESLWSCTDGFFLVTWWDAPVDCDSFFHLFSHSYRAIVFFFMSYSTCVFVF